MVPIPPQDLTRTRLDKLLAIIGGTGENALQHFLKGNEKPLPSLITLY
jgi:hypothetical protein